MSLIRVEPVTLSSGAESSWKLDCDQFIEENLDGLVYLLRTLAGPFSSVEGVPRGGTRLADALWPHALGGAPRPGVPHLIVDDVLTTGQSLNEARITYLAGFINSEPEHIYQAVTGVVLFARGPILPWVQALWPMPQCFWLPPREKHS